MIRRKLIGCLRDVPPAVVLRRRGRYTSSIVLSERRLQEFMRAEIGYFAGMSSQPIQLAQIFKASTAELAADLILRQLPVHFASRIQQLEALPRWETVPELREVHSTLAESFRNLRLLESASDLEPLTEAINGIRNRHKTIIMLLGVAMAHLRREGVVDETFANQWLDKFLLARISTEMLTLHYTLMISASDQAPESCTGIVDSRCDPSEICRQAVANVQKDPMYKNIPMPVESYVCSSSEKGIEFSFLPAYLLIVVEELIKNSACATVRHYSSLSASSVPAAHRQEKQQFPPICVFVGADDRQVMIEVSDKAGGIPTSQRESIWSYTNSASPDCGGHSPEEQRHGLSWTDPLAGLGIKQRLGMGLPLTRLYTQYLGGSLELMSIPGIGADTFINLRRIDSNSVQCGTD